MDKSSSEFYPLTVLKIARETPSSMVIDLQPPLDELRHFDYRPGQYLTFRHQDEERIELRRSYSLCSIPEEKIWQVAIKQVPEGIFSTYANKEIKQGDTLWSMRPSGNFIKEQKSGKSNILFVAVGSGITPIISLLRHSLRANPHDNCTLWYGNRTTKEIMFKEKIEEEKNLYLQRLAVHYFLSKEKSESPLFSGRLDKLKFEELDAHLSLIDFDECFLCGPEEMLLDFKSFVQEKGYKLKVHFELFGTNLGLRKTSKKELEDHKGKISRVSIKLDGRSTELEMPYEGQRILDLALDAGLDLPFACKGGVCCTCRAKVEEGAVEMDINYALEEEEVEEGYILTCQAHPRSEYLKINFDIGH